MGMNEDVVEGKLKQAKGKLREWWGDLTDDDVEAIGGKKDQLVGKLQERYGWTKARAEDEVKTRMNDYEAAASDDTLAGRR